MLVQTEQDHRGYDIPDCNQARRSWWQGMTPDSGPRHPDDPFSRLKGKIRGALQVYCSCDRPVKKEKENSMGQ